MFQTSAQAVAADPTMTPSDLPGSRAADTVAENTERVLVFKRAFRTSASGISIIMFNSDAVVHGFTATSLTSVSMDPPLALFCVSKQSRSCLHLTVGLTVGFSFLAEDQAEHARFFSSMRPFGQCGSIELERFDSVPIVANCAAAISAVIAQTIPAGDHIIFICALRCARSLEGSAPLLYHCGGYGGLVRNS